MKRYSQFQKTKGFTLVELLIVIAIIAVLALVVLLVINPAELLKQSRDSGRLSDMSALRSAIQSYQADVPTASLGTSTITYLSLIDLSATTTLGTDCTALGLPGGTYHCAASSSARAVDGSGWLPLNLAAISSKSPLSLLPIDPVNTTSSNLYYTYATDGTTWKVSSFPESQKYQSQLASGASTFQSGTNLFLNSPVPGLVGWWKFDEGSGSTAADSSGYNNTGGWVGTAAGTSGYYSAGKIGNFAGTFDGSSTYVNFGTSTNLNFGTASFSITAWINTGEVGVGRMLTKRAPGDTSWYSLILNLSPNCFSLETSAGVGACDSIVVNDARFHNIVAVKSGATVTYYVDGNSAGTVAASLNLVSAANLISGQWNLSAGQYFQGILDDVRVYNRALTPAEIGRIYSGTE